MANDLHGGTEAPKVLSSESGASKRIFMFGTSSAEGGIVASQYKEGSAQEFDGTRILGRFPEDDEFGLEGGHPLRLQQEVAEISIAASSTE
jgi:hypothetical protein